MPTTKKIALPTPKKHKDGEWHTKIQIAKQAREQAQQARKGKPMTLTTRRTHVI